MRHYIIGICLLAVIVGCNKTTKEHNATLPVATTDVRVKKKQFFDTLLPIAQEINAEIATQKEKLQDLYDNKNNLTNAQEKWLTAINKTYKLKDWNVE